MIYIIATVAVTRASHARQLLRRKATLSDLSPARLCGILSLAASWLVCRAVIMSPSLFLGGCRLTRELRRSQTSKFGSLER